jgi:leucyl/phenylalanyl-tRNA--protein transferase
MSGVEITPELILNAYRHGYFPMTTGKHGPIDFYYYEPRGIIPLDARFTVRRSLAQFIRNGPLRVTSDRAFESVIRNCARHDSLPDEEIWLSEEMILVYVQLHTMGFAHSIEVYEADELVGGLYGLALGSVFCGESMFSTRPYASQVALVGLVERLRAGGFTILDAQMQSEHLAQFGMYTITQEEYLRLLSVAIGETTEWVNLTQPSE